MPGLASVEVDLLDSVAEKALVAENLLVSRSSLPALLVPGLASVEEEES